MTRTRAGERQESFPRSLGFGGVPLPLKAVCDYRTMSCVDRRPFSVTFSPPMHDDLSRFCCQNPNCPQYGQRDAGNLTVCARYGPHQRRLLYCRGCQYRFSERKGTPLFGTQLPDTQALDILAHLADGCGVRQTARLTGTDKDTVARFALRAGPHARQLHDELAAFSPSDPPGPGR